MLNTFSGPWHASHLFLLPQHVYDDHLKRKYMYIYIMTFSVTKFKFCDYHFWVGFFLFFFFWVKIFVLAFSQRTNNHEEKFYVETIIMINEEKSRSTSIIFRNFTITKWQSFTKSVNKNTSVSFIIYGWCDSNKMKQ